MEGCQTNSHSHLLSCQDEDGEAVLTKSIKNCLYVPLVQGELVYYTSLSYMHAQMVPLIENSAQGLLKRMGEIAESGQSADIFK